MLTEWNLSVKSKKKQTKKPKICEVMKVLIVGILSNHVIQLKHILILFLNIPQCSWKINIYTCINKYHSISINISHILVTFESEHWVGRNMREPPGIKNILDLGLGSNYAGVYNILRLVHRTSLLNTFESIFKVRVVEKKAKKVKKNLKLKVISQMAAQTLGKQSSFII